MYARIPMRSRKDQFDFTIVIGSGFGAAFCSITEKATKLRYGDGRRWSPETLPHSNWSIHRWLSVLSLACGFLRFFSDATSSAAQWWRIHYLCEHAAPSL
jgi:cholesterol oxidase